MGDMNNMRSESEVRHFLERIEKSNLFSSQTDVRGILMGSLRYILGETGKVSNGPLGSCNWVPVERRQRFRREEDR